MDEMVTILRKFWQGGMVEHHGEHFDFEPLEISPAPGRQVPIYVGGANPVALRRAAQRGEGWLGAGNTPDEVPPILAELTRLRREAGRDNLPFETVIGLKTPPAVDTFKRLEEHGMTAGVNYPFMFGLGRTSTLDQKKKVMEQFAEQIIRHCH
jgi:alkanesulfonate monooxygenase SsuD/methylene tetrahydromethanopterin reductase-like flavin-dependent oxidoreductase (luciferase family)